MLSATAFDLADNIYLDLDTYLYIRHLHSLQATNKNSFYLFNFKNIYLTRMPTEKLHALIHIWILKTCQRSLIGDLSQARETLLVWPGINTFLDTAVLAGLLGQLVPCQTESTSLGMESGQAISYQCRMSWTVVRKLYHLDIYYVRK